MGLFSSMGSFFLGITGVPNGGFDALGRMYMAAPPNLQNWFMQYGKQHMAEMKGPFEQVMGSAFQAAPKDVQAWAGEYARANKMDWLSHALHPAAPAAPAAAAGPMQAVAAPVAGSRSDQLRAGIISTAQALGIRPVDLATAIAYETVGSFDPWKAGPVTQWGQHRGLIQWGEPQARKYGVGPATSIPDQMNAVTQYLRDAGVKPGMGLMDLYSAINAGRVGMYGASDKPGFNIATHVQAMQPYVGTAQKLLGGADVLSGARPMAVISSNPDAALVYAAGMASPSDPGPLPGLSSPAVPAAPAAPAPEGGPMAAAASGRGFGGLGVGIFSPSTMSFAQIEKQVGPLETALQAGQANQVARARAEGLIATPETVGTSGKPMQMANQPAQQAGVGPATGVMQRILASPKLAKAPASIRYRA